MGLFDAIERKLEGAVQGAFARAFKGDVQPIEITARIQRELDSKATLLSHDRKLVPNVFVIKLSQQDHDRLSPYAKTISEEIKPQLTEYASQNNYVFNGPVTLHFTLDESLPTGKFKLDTRAEAGVAFDNLNAPKPATPAAPNHQPFPPVVLPDVENPNSDLYVAEADSALENVDDINQAGDVESDLSVASDTALAPEPVPTPQKPEKFFIEVHNREYELTAPGFIIGRGTEADIRISDPGISRKHAQIMVSVTGEISILDLGSTNGISVNGNRVSSAPLSEGSVIEIGSTRMVISRHV